MELGLPVPPVGKRDQSIPRLDLNDLESQVDVEQQQHSSSVGLKACNDIDLEQHQQSADNIAPDAAPPTTFQEIVDYSTATGIEACFGPLYAMERYFS